MTRAKFSCQLAAIFICAAALPASAQDPQRGQALYELNCLTCHYERIHKRDPSRSLVSSNARLRLEVAQRAANTGQRFTIEDLDDIAEYLDRTHYRFPRADARSVPSPGR